MVHDPYLLHIFSKYGNWNIQVLLKLPAGLWSLSYKVGDSSIWNIFLTLLVAEILRSNVWQKPLIICEKESKQIPLDTCAILTF